MTRGYSRATNCLPALVRAGRRPEPPPAGLAAPRVYNSGRRKCAIQIGVDSFRSCRCFADLTAATSPRELENQTSDVVSFTGPSCDMP
jgi:hypothetical protein